MKKKIAMLLAAVMCWTCCLPAYAADAATEAPEVNEPMLDYAFLSSAEISEQDGMVVVSRTMPAEEPAARSASDGVSMVKETVAIIPKKDSTTQDVIDELEAFKLAKVSGSKYEEGADSTGSIKIYSTIYYNRKTQNNRNYVLLTKADGGYTILDMAASVSSQKVTLGCNGAGEAEYGTQITHRYPTSSRWSYTTPSNWKYIYDDMPLSGLGVTYEVTFKEYGSTYTHSMNNSLFSNPEMNLLYEG